MLRLCPLTILLSASALAVGCGPERPPLPDSYASASPSPQSAGRKELPATAYRIEWSPIAAPATMKPGERVDLPVAFKNSGDTAWPASGRGDLYVVRFSQRWLRANGELVADYGALRFDLPEPVPAGQAARVMAVLVAPSVPGDYVVQFDLVHEGVAWFADRGAAKQFVPIQVR
jgi:hypothetical protein